MPTQPTYRPDIDGLRAIAVLAVVIFHAFPAVLPGGFIGVDVFFVISGFLITNIILKGLEQDSFSFAQFYAHRIRRIFPALILVLCACFAFGWFALLPIEYKQLGKHIAGSSAFVSNWIFWQEAGYFDNAADTKPLLHLWSLGIEEQFYIVWPVLVWALFRWRLNILTFTIIALLASLAYSGVVIGRPDLVKDFYSPLTRFWELLIGALLAYGATSSSPRLTKLKTWLQDSLSALVFDEPYNTAHRLRQFGSIIGLLLFISGLVLINQKTVFPGYYALLPTLGAVCLIGAGPHTWINRYLLSNRLLVGIGLISYPLYLWHKPLLSFAKILEGETVSWKLKLLLVAVAVILSVATYWLIEKPIRFGKHQKVKTIILVLLMSIIGYVGYNTYVRNGLGFRDVSPEAAMIMDASEPLATRNSDGSCEQLLGLREVKKEVCLTNSSSPTTLIVGDSHAMALNSSVLAGKIPLGTLLIAGHACPPLENYGVIWGGQNPALMGHCMNITKNAIDAASNIKSLKYVIFATRGPQYIHNPKLIDEKTGLPQAVLGFDRQLTPIADVDKIFIDGYSESIKAYQKLGLKTIFLIDNPELGFNPLNCVVKRKIYPNKSLEGCKPNTREKVFEWQSHYRYLVNKVSEKNKALIIFDPIDIFCSSTECINRTSSNLLYFDDNHLSVSGSEILMNNLVNKFILK